MLVVGDYPSHVTYLRHTLTTRGSVLESALRDVGLIRSRVTMLCSWAMEQHAIREEKRYS